MKIFFLLLIVTQFVLDIEAKQALSKERVDVFYTFGSNNNESESRENSISADITGHTLTINFNEDVGIAQIVIRNSNGIYIDSENVFSTPDYATFYINDAGYYRMDITLSNGEQYYGYFRVEN